MVELTSSFAMRWALSNAAGEENAPKRSGGDAVTVVSAVSLFIGLLCPESVPLTGFATVESTGVVPDRGIRVGTRRAERFDGGPGVHGRSRQRASVHSRESVSLPCAVKLIPTRRVRPGYPHCSGKLGIHSCARARQAHIRT